MDGISAQTDTLPFKIAEPLSLAGSVIALCYIRPMSRSNVEDSQQPKLPEQSIDPRLPAQKPHVVAIDLGGTNIRAARCDGSGHILQRARQLTRPQDGTRAVLDRIVQSVRDMAGDGDTIHAVGVASPGTLNPYTGLVLYAPNLGWTNVPLQTLLQDELGLPVGIGNDANLAALGEQQYGAGQGIANLVYVTLSTGIGSGVILNNQLVLGAHGLATEGGHMTVDVFGPISGSGVPGGFEGYAAGPAIARLAQQKLREGRASTMQELAGGDIANVSAREVGDAAQLGDPLANEIVQHVARIIGLGFVNLLHLFDPEILVVGGSVALMGDLLLDPVRATIQQYAMPPYRGVPVVPAMLGDDCGLLGAAALAVQQR